MTTILGPDLWNYWPLNKEEKDVSFNMKAGAKSFITKPATFDEWVEI